MNILKKTAPARTELLPDSYRGIREEELIEKIHKRKSLLGKNLVFLAHHYQRAEIVEMSDFRGDSFGLSRIASEQSDAEFILFCGVHFMAESAEILSSQSQTVLHPNPFAGCPLADMARIEDVFNAWNELSAIAGNNVLPVTYMNSRAELKAFCGKNGGTVCTSTNAAKVFDWAFARKDKLFFFPDEHLGRNTALSKGIRREKIILWDPGLSFGGNTAESIKGATVILWKGHCHVHTRFLPEHIHAARKKYPGCKIVVHPECKVEVIELADANGSTDFIVRYANSQPPGSTIAIGTEINLISRLAGENTDKKVVELRRSLCPNMYRITLNHILWTLDNPGKVNVIHVPEQIKNDARTALERMLEII
ncbi:MAG TPA: quinolinate synthase NadA [bacterium]